MTINALCHEPRLPAKMDLRAPPHSGASFFRKRGSRVGRRARALCLALPAGAKDRPCGLKSRFESDQPGILNSPAVMLFGIFATAQFKREQSRRRSFSQIPECCDAGPGSRPAS